MKITRMKVFRKISIISLAVLVFVSSLLGANANTAQAVGVDTVIKLVGGKAIVRALAEKAGMQLSKKQIDNVAGYIEKKTFDGDQGAIDFVKKANALTPDSTSTKTGFKKYLLDPAAWLFGLDLIFLAVDAFQDGYDNAVPVGLYLDGCNQTDPSGYNATYPYWVEFSRSDQPGSRIVAKWSSPNGFFTGGPNITLTNPGYFDSKKFNGSYWDNNGSGYLPTGVKTIYTGLTATILSSSTGVCSPPVSESDVINITNVDNSVKNYFDTDITNNTTYVMQVDIPDTIDYNDPAAWNEKDPQLPEELDPPPPEPDSDGDGIPDSEDDSDGDGITDDKDSDADGDGFLENLLGIIALIALFDLLKAVLFYLARMFDFILTIPLIEAIPIDNVAFEWFRTADIVGIQIYSVVSLLATIGLSFAVYKVVRRLIP